MLRPAAALLVLLAILALLVNLPAREPEGLLPVAGSLFVNGKPAAGAVVVLHPVGDDRLSATQPAGHVGPDGRFQLSSTNRMGAPPGEYVVTVSWFAPAAMKKGGKSSAFADPEKVQSVEKLGYRYTDRKKSGITRTIVRGTTELEPIHLTDPLVSP